MTAAVYHVLKLLSFHTLPDVVVWKLSSLSTWYTAAVIVILHSLTRGTLANFIVVIRGHPSRTLIHTDINVGKLTVARILASYTEVFIISIASLQRCPFETRADFGVISRLKAPRACV